MRHLPASSFRSVLYSSVLCVLCGCADDTPTPGVPRGLSSVQDVAKSLEPPAPEPTPSTTPPALPQEEDLGDIPKEGTYTVKFETSAGDFVIEVNRAWAPRGAHRFKELIDAGFYNDCRFFRVVSNFVVQFGMSGNPKIGRDWDRIIKDDPVAQNNRRGYVTFATSGPDSRTTQVFINLKTNTNLDNMGFAPIGKVIEGLHVVDVINQEYGEQPNQQLIQEAGNDYLNREFPRLDYIKRATLVGETKP